MRPGAINLGTTVGELCQCKADFLSEFPCLRADVTDNPFAWKHQDPVFLADMAIAFVVRWTYRQVAMVGRIRQLVGVGAAWSERKGPHP